MTKRLLALLMAMAMIFALAACGGTTSSDSAPVSEAAASAEAEAPADDQPATLEEPVVEEPTSEMIPVEPGVTPYEDVPATELPLSDGSETFEIWMGISPAAMNYITTLAENLTYMEIMERTGVNLSFIHFHPDTQTEQFNLICASGDYPDVMNGVANNYTGGADKGIEDEVFIDLNDYLEEYAPHYYSLIHSDAQLYDQVTTPEGAVVGFYSLYEEARLNDTGYIIRQDWLDKLDLSMPKTIDELHTALTGFKEEMGATDALFIPSTGVSDYFIAAYGVGSGVYVEDGVMKYGPFEAGFKEYLQTMAQWYSEDLIYHDFAFYGEQLNFRDNGMIGAGQVACFRSETGDMASFGNFSDDPDLLMTAMAPVAKAEGETIYMTDAAPSRADDIRWALTTGCEDPELLVSMVDYLYSPEGALLCNYGLEGQTFEYVDGTPKFSDMINNNPEYDYRTAVFLYCMDSGPFLVDPYRGTSSYTQEQLDSWSDWTDADLDYSRVVSNKVILKAQDDEYTSIMSDIETFMDEMTVKYITGEYSFDNYETDFVQALKDMNAERIVELYQEAYDYYNA